MALSPEAIKYYNSEFWRIHNELPKIQDEFEQFHQERPQFLFNVSLHNPQGTSSRDPKWVVVFSRRQLMSGEKPGWVETPDEIIGKTRKRRSDVTAFSGERGVNFSPDEISEIVTRFQQIADRYLLVVRNNTPVNPSRTEDEPVLIHSLAPKTFGK